MSRPKIELVYCPCTCPAYEREMGEVSDQPTAEHFDREGIAAMRVREHVLAGEPFAVHHAGAHVKAAVIDGERFPKE